MASCNSRKNTNRRIRSTREFISLVIVIENPTIPTYCAGSCWPNRHESILVHYASLQTVSPAGWAASSAVVGSDEEITVVASAATAAMTAALLAGHMRS